MITLENLDDQTSLEIYEDAKKQIGYLTNDWDNLQEADPGMTLVEAFAWLKQVQHEYLNRMPPEIIYRFLKLLNSESKHSKAAETLIEVANVKQNVALPVKTKWQNGDIVFENKHAQTLIKSKILSVIFQNQDGVKEIEYYKFSDKPYFVFGENYDKIKDKDVKRQFYLNFDEPLPENSEINLYFSVFEEKELKRNVVKKHGRFEDLAKVRWEYYGKENGKLGWHEIEVVFDGTKNFLFSNVIKLKIKGKTTPIQGQYTLRCALIYDEYDYSPRITKIKTNVFTASIQETLCENVIIKKEELLDGNIAKFTTYLSLYGKNEVYLGNGDSWVEKKDLKIEKNFEVGEVFITLPEPCDVMLVSYDDKKLKDLILGSGTGIGAQNFEFLQKNLIWDGIELLVAQRKDENGELVFEKWGRALDFQSSGKYDKNFVFREDPGVILFGDNIHGIAPRNFENNIKICSLITSLGEKSNAKAGAIKNAKTDNEILNKSTVVQIHPAKGGRDEEPLEKAVARAARVLDNSGRAVTIEDYKKIVEETPGLIFKNVKILPNYMPGEDVNRQNCITIAVRWSNKVGLKLPKSYEKNILNHLERYRLICTKIQVVAPEYIGLRITGQVAVDPSYREKEKIIERAAEKFIEKINEDMGSVFHYGDLFTMIGNLEEIAYVEKLFITPTNNSAHKTASEDIIIPLNGVYYIESLNINCIRSSKI